MKTCIHIERITVTNEKNFTLYHSLIDGTNVWIRVPSTFSINPSAELFISCCLLEAMVSNRDISISPDIPISAVFQRKIFEIQKIYRSWNRKLNVINIEANYCAEPTPNAGVGVFYSGGIDSSYTLCERIDEITHLITLNGFDRSESPEEWNELIARHKSLAELLGKEIICIEHNFHEFNSLRMICREFQHGLTLAGIAVSTGLAKVFIPASSPYKHLVPWGTHPCTDPLWSTGTTQLIHHGAELSRTERTKFLADFPSVFNNIQVCWEHISRNCGKCPKCLRTMAACYLLQVKPDSLPIIELNNFKKITATSEVGQIYLYDLIGLSKQVGALTVEKTLTENLRKFKIRYHAEALVNVITRNYLKNIVHKLRKTEWVKFRVVMNSDIDA